jgi:HNH endonuclease
MVFSEQLKVMVRKRSHLRCCLCHDLGVDIHHIVPQAEDGPDAEDNAAALCPSCHDRYGANPDKRKLIREARDLWYEICASRFSSGSADLKEIAETLRGLATKEDLERFALRNATYVLGASGKETAPSGDDPYSFMRPEFIHPLIVRELLGWISDPAATVIAVDLTSANRSNRFFGEFSIASRDGRTWVEWAGDKGEYFTYAHIANSPSGIQMVECYDGGGGSGVFGSVALFSLERDQALAEERNAKLSARPRIILKSLGSVTLGDRYKGKIAYEGRLLVIGPDDGWFKRGKEASKALPIE